MDRRATCTTLFLITAVLFGCAEANGPDDRAAQEKDVGSANPPSSAERPTGQEGRKDRSVSPVNPRTGRRARTLPDGTIVYSRELDVDAKTSPEDGCGRSRIRGLDGAYRSRAVPPSPGLQARQEGSRVRVDVEVGLPGRSCTPFSLSVLVDDSSDAYPPIPRDFRVKAGDSRRIVVELTPQMTRPDHVRGTLISKDGRASETARVSVGR